MKTTNYFRNAALALMLIMTASFTFSQGDNKISDNLNLEKAEFANAGYWIDAVVVNAISEKSDRELLASKGYFIDPVVVTYNNTVPDYFPAQDANVLCTMDKEMEDLEASMLKDGLVR